MPKYRTIKINNRLHKIRVDESALIADVLAVHAPSAAVIPCVYEKSAPLFVLMNEQTAVDAHAARASDAQSITTVEYALAFPYFQTCLDLLCKNGVLLRESNTALLLFSLFALLKKPSLGRMREAGREQLQKEVQLLSFHFPDLFEQSDAFMSTYREILQLEKSVGYFSVHFAFDSRHAHASSALAHQEDAAQPARAQADHVSATVSLEFALAAAAQQAMQKQPPKKVLGKVSGKISGQITKQLSGKGSEQITKKRHAKKRA